MRPAASVRRPDLARILARTTLCAAAAIALALPALPASAAATPTCQGVTATIVGTTGNDTLTGTSGRDVIHADAGNDTVNGLGGDDIICGGDGDDTLVGGAGTDTLDGGNGTDTVSYAAETTAVTVSLGTGTATGTVSGTDKLLALEKVVGGSAADKLTGNGSNNAISGGGGNDVIDGAGGWDACDAGTGDDKLTDCESVVAQTETSGAVDTATVSPASGTRFFLNNRNSATTTTRALTWTLTNPNGSTSFTRQSVGATDAGSFTAAGGTYTVSMTGTVAGTHRWDLVLPTTQTFPLTLGTTVAADSPSKGMGRLEGPQDRDAYTFTGTAGQRVYLDAISDSTGGRGVVTLSGPSGQVMQTYLGVDRGPITLPAAGTYTLTVGVGGSLDTVGTYSFVLRTVPAAQTFGYTIGSTISNGSPASGAGNLEAAGSVDTYTFAGTRGQGIYVDALGDTVSGDATLVIKAPDGSTVVNSYVEVDSGLITLPATGTYTMTVKMNDNDPRTGTYSLVLKAAGGGTGSYAYTLGTTVSDGVPGAGAGNLEAAGAKDTYTFTGTAGQVLFYDNLADRTGNYGWVTLTGPSGQSVLQTWIAYDRGNLVLPASGTYTLTVATTDTTHIGTYSFRLLVTPAEQKFAYTLGTTVSNGVPGSGAGNLETIGSVDRYTFSGTAGQKISYDYLSDTTGNYAQIWVYDAAGSQVLNAWIGYDTSFTLPATGSYSLVVRTGVDDSQHTGTYSFVLR